MKRNFTQFIAVALCLGISVGCEPLEPEESNVYDIDDVRSVVTYAEGFLIHAYLMIPGSHNQFPLACASDDAVINRSEEHTSELQSLMRISYAVFCLKKKK